MLFSVSVTVRFILYCTIFILTESFSVLCLHSIIYGGTFGNTHVLFMTNIRYQVVFAHAAMSQSVSPFYLFRLLFVCVTPCTDILNKPLNLTDD